MSHTNSHIYSEVVNGVKIGINTDDVGAVIGVASNDIGTLCYSSSKINKWARNKPEAIGGPEDITDAQRKANNFALRMTTTYTTIQNYVNAAKGVNGITLEGWVYDAPRADRNDWARLTDFDGYRADAQCPFPTVMGGVHIMGSIQGKDMLEITLAAGYEGAVGNTDYIRIADLNKADAKYSDWYAGVLLISTSNAAKFYLATASTTISNGVKVRFTQDNGMPKVPTGDYKGYVFLANRAFSASDSYNMAQSGGFQMITITKESVPVSVITSTQTLIVTCSMQSQKLAVSVTNKNKSAVVITPVRFERSATGSASDAATLAVLDPLTAFTVAAATDTNTVVTETKTYRAPVVGMTGYVRMVYNYKVGNNTEVKNATTEWTMLASAVIPNS